MLDHEHERWSTSVQRPARTRSFVENDVRTHGDGVSAYARVGAGAGEDTYTYTYTYLRNAGAGCPDGRLGSKGTGLTGNGLTQQIFARFDQKLHMDHPSQVRFSFCKP